MVAPSRVRARARVRVRARARARVRVRVRARVWSRVIGRGLGLAEHGGDTAYWGGAE